jgi:adenosylmethionine-8-amino-7-oxononanoate aminotransferase
VLFDCVHVPFPEPDAHARAFEALARAISEGHETIAAVFVEPMVQGSSGMRVYDAAYLRELRRLTEQHDVLLAVDEVFAGYGRTGPMWATEHAGIHPDLMCLGKAMSPFLPMGATLATDRVQDAFRGTKDRALMYGHTLCGNPLGAALALEVLDVYRDERVLEGARAKAERIAKAFARTGELPGVARTRGDSASKADRRSKEARRALHNAPFRARRATRTPSLESGPRWTASCRARPCASGCCRFRASSAALPPPSPTS